MTPSGYPRTRGRRLPAGRLLHRRQARKHGVSRQLLNHHVGRDASSACGGGSTASEASRAPSTTTSARSGWRSEGEGHRLPRERARAARAERQHPRRGPPARPAQAPGTSSPAEVSSSTPAPTTRRSATVWRDGMPITAPARTLVDVADELQPEQAAMAVRQALGLGLLTRRQLEQEAARQGKTRVLETLLPIDEIRDRSRVPPGARRQAEGRGREDRARPRAPAEARRLRALPPSPRRGGARPLGAERRPRARLPLPRDQHDRQRHGSWPRRRRGRGGRGLRRRTGARARRLLHVRRTRTDALDDAADFRAIRFHVTAELAGRIFDQFVVDVGFADSFSWTPDTVETSDLLSFAGIERIRVPALPLPEHIAEKVHAYTRKYGPKGRESTRPKDLVDILLIAHRNRSAPLAARGTGDHLQAARPAAAAVEPAAAARRELARALPPTRNRGGRRSRPRQRVRRPPRSSIRFSPDARPAFGTLSGVPGLTKAAGRRRTSAPEVSRDLDRIA